MAKKLKDKASWVTISTDEYESMRATIEVLSDPDLMRQIKESEIAIKEGRVKDWDEFVDEVLKSKKNLNIKKSA